MNRPAPESVNITETFCACSAQSPWQHAEAPETGRALNPVGVRPATTPGR